MKDFEFTVSRDYTVTAENFDEAIKFLKKDLIKCFGKDSTFTVNHRCR